MPEVGQIERLTQNRIVKLFTEKLGYKYLGCWEDRLNNSNIETELLTKYLKRIGYSENLISKALDNLYKAANNYNRSLYENNKEIYEMLRYGVKVKEGAEENYETVKVIDWNDPEANEFGIAEEVTVLGEKEKRPDIVLYINGIAIAVIEFKRSTISIGEGIRQSIVNQRKEFIQSFFSTVQFVFAGNNTEGLRYGSIGTPEKYFLNWKEDLQDDNMFQLDKYLLKLCNKKRLLELIYDFVIFDGGIKKLPRHHQYFAVKVAQDRVVKKEGGIIWHTQGSGKSIVMVLLAKWILENNPNARIAIITDREELDKQIKRVFEDAGEEIYRTSSGKDLIVKLNQAKPRLLCSLVHKFGRRGVDNFDEFIKGLTDTPVNTVGELFIFVDECHRTQSGKLNKTMKAMLPNAVFIGFTGTPLLKQDKQTSLEVFGSYIHTYKFKEAVADKVILDLVYEARDIEQKLSSPEKVDAWFESKTKGLNDYQKNLLKRKWGTMQSVLSSKSRIEKIVRDVEYDFTVKPRINSESGNAILVAGSIYEACKYYKFFRETGLRDKCAIITSYSPASRDIVSEDTGESTVTQKKFVFDVYTELLNGATTELYEEKEKEKFIKEPATMKLLIVVDKLLTGFDAPHCTYLYIDKSMQDHGLFQAICRVNRLDGDDKIFGYIVDYKDLFRKVENAIAVYTSDLDYDTFEKEECDIMIQDRLAKGREKLEKSLEELSLICEPVPEPEDSLNNIRYFCGNPEIQDDLKKNEVKRTALYKATAELVRSYANIADDLIQAGYTNEAKENLEKELNHYINLREEIRKASGESLDLKTYEADMRHLIDTYIQAEDSRVISDFGDMSLLDIIVKTGIEEAIKTLPKGITGNERAVAETIENNVRQKIIRDTLIDPAFYEEMSKLLNEIIKERNTKAINYEKYLSKIAVLVKKVHEGKDDKLPSEIKTNAQRALYNNLNKDLNLAISIDKKILEVKPDDFRGNEQKERVVKRAIYEVVNDVNEVERIYAIVKQQREY